jgi:hypothetical protein
MYQSIPPPSVPFPPVGTTPNVVFSQGHPPAQGPAGPTCRGMPLCAEVGLNILQQMKGIPGRPGWLYVSDIFRFHLLI